MYQVPNTASKRRTRALIAEHGQSVIEYALVVALVSIVLVGAVAAMMLAFEAELEAKGLADLAALLS